MRYKMVVLVLGYALFCLALLNIFYTSFLKVHKYIRFMFSLVFCIFVTHFPKKTYITIPIKKGISRTKNWLSCW